MCLQDLGSALLLAASFRASGLSEPASRTSKKAVVGGQPSADPKQALLLRRLHPELPNPNLQLKAKLAVPEDECGETFHKWIYLRWYDQLRCQ